MKKHNNYRYKSPLANVRKLILELQNALIDFPGHSTHELYEINKGLQFLIDLNEKDIVTTFSFTDKGIEHTARIVDLNRSEKLRPDLVILSLMRGNSMVNLTRTMKNKVCWSYMLHSTSIHN